MEIQAVNALDKLGPYSFVNNLLQNVEYEKFRNTIYN